MPGTQLVEPTCLGIEPRHFEMGCGCPKQHLTCYTEYLPPSPNLNIGEKYLIQNSKLMIFVVVLFVSVLEDIAPLQPFCAPKPWLVFTFFSFLMILNNFRLICHGSFQTSSMRRVIVCIKFGKLWSQFLQVLLSLHFLASFSISMVFRNQILGTKFLLLLLGSAVASQHCQPLGHTCYGIHNRVTNRRNPLSVGVRVGMCLTSQTGAEI